MGVLAWLAVPAVADDVQPPPWRGQWSTTSQIWEFLTPNPGDPAGEGLRPDGPAPGGQPPLPSTMLWVTPGPGMEWMPEDLVTPESQRVGIWPLSGAIEVVVDNHEPPNELKWVWVQLTWRPQPTGGIPEISGLQPSPIRAEDMPKVVEEVTLPCGWVETTYEWFLRPNPPDEWFTVGGMIDVDELVIDTWCIPEPSTLAMLLGMSLLVFWRRRR